MFDNNPFREYKNMIRLRKLQEERPNPQDAFGGREADYNAETEHGHYLNQITDELGSAVRKGNHSSVYKLFKKYHKDLTPNHLDMITSMHSLPGNSGYHDLVKEVPLHPSATDRHRMWAQHNNQGIRAWADEPSQLPPGSRITD